MCYTQHMTNPATPDRQAHLTELLTRASWRIRRGGKKELAALGLAFGQARALRVIARESDPLRMSELAARLEIVPRSATTMVDALENAGLVSRLPDPADRRSVLARVTPEGLALMKRIAQQRRDSATELFAVLSDDEQEQLLALLGKLCGPPEGDR